jgi:hypothetical protein
MDFPLATGAVVRLLNVPETRLATLIRLRKVAVPVTAGRRLWMPEHVLSAAKLLGVDTPSIRNICMVRPPSSQGSRP